jgi:hypothetical protein
MKHSLLLLLVAHFLLACGVGKPTEKTSVSVGDNTANSSANIGRAPASAGALADADGQKIIGSYVGPFGDNKITLLITKVNGNSVSGRSIVAGNDRPFDGTFSFENAVYNVVAKEPGDHKDDGVFNFNISAGEPNEVKGTWKANDPKRPEKSFVLGRRKFEYRANVGNWPEASTRTLKADDVENLSKDNLEYMRNEIFARHGYCFNKKNLRQEFENEAWYVPNTVDIRGYLTDVEKKNIALIKRYEKYADEYGDEFGR